MVTSRSYHNFSAEDLDALQEIFDRECLETPEACRLEPDRLDLARKIVVSTHAGLSEMAIATLAMSLII